VNAAGKRPSPALVAVVRACPPGERCFQPGEDGVLLRGCTVVRRLPTAATFER